MRRVRTGRMRPFIARFTFFSFIVEGGQEGFCRLFMAWSLVWFVWTAVQRGGFGLTREVRVSAVVLSCHFFLATIVTILQRKTQLIIYRVFQVKRPITKLYIWAQGGCREEGRVLLYSVSLPIFCVKISASQLKRFKNDDFQKLRYQKP
jgi:hypothetical protein